MHFYSLTFPFKKLRRPFVELRTQSVIVAMTYRAQKYPFVLGVIDHQLGNIWLYLHDLWSHQMQISFFCQGGSEYEWFSIHVILRKSQPQEERKPIYQTAYVIKAIIQIGANIGIFIFTLIKLFVRFSFFMPRMSFKWKNGIADNFAKTTLLQLTGPVSSLVCNLELGLQFWYYCGVTQKLLFVT